MQRACTCALGRVLAVSAEQLVHNISKSSNPIASTSALCRSTGRRSLTTGQAWAYPRQATPFSATNRPLDDTVLAGEEVEGSLLSQSEGQASTRKSTSKSPSSSTAWYLSESPSSSASSSTSNTTSGSPKEVTPTIPNPPHTLPSYLLPLWNHVYESPFLDRQTINFIDSKMVQENVSIENMDASVSSWVDWVVVASLRSGRERGIRGASEGVKVAMKECLKVFDEQLAASESKSTSTPLTPKRKKKIPPVLVEGLEIKEPQWALIDGGKAVIHVMTSKARKTWQVEGVASAFSEVNKEMEKIGGEEAECENTRDSGRDASEIGGGPMADREKRDFQPRM